MMCDSDGLWLAKAAAVMLDAWEQPNLGDIIHKIGGAVCKISTEMWLDAKEAERKAAGSPPPD